MRQTKLQPFGILVLALATSAAACVDAHVPAQPTGDGASSSVSVPVDGSNVVYELAPPDADEGDEWGPTALHASDDGTFWIETGPGNGALHVAADGTPIKRIDYGTHVVLPRDVLPVGDRLFVLDVSREHPGVVELDMHGGLVAEHAIDHELIRRSVGLKVSETGTVLLWLAGADVLELEHASLGATRKDARSFVQAGTSYGISAPGRSASIPGHTVELSVGPTRVRVELDEKLGAADLLHVASDGSFFVLIEEYVLTPYIHADDTIWHFSAEGELLGKARLPVDESRLPVELAATFTSEDELVALVTHADHLELRYLPFEKDLEPVLPEAWSDYALVARQDAERERAQRSKAAELSACRYQGDMWEVFEEYWTLRLYYSNDNINGTCSGRAFPTGFFGNGGPGYYEGTAYAYGKWDTVSSYTRRVADGEVVGNVRSPTRACAIGIDCSGLITRMWGHPNKLGTATIPSHTVSLGPGGASSLRSNLAFGDVANKPKTQSTSGHVRMFDAHYDSSQAFWIESSGSQGGVVSRLLKFSQFNGYLPRRYKYFCYGGW